MKNLFSCQEIFFTSILKRTPSKNLESKSTIEIFEKREIPKFCNQPFAKSLILSSMVVSRSLEKNRNVYLLL